MASVLLVALLVIPWLLTARRREAFRWPDRPARIPSPAQQPVRPWIDPDDWWRDPSASPDPNTAPSAA